MSAFLASWYIARESEAADSSDIRSPLGAMSTAVLALNASTPGRPRRFYYSPNGSSHWDAAPMRPTNGSWDSSPYRVVLIAGLSLVGSVVALLLIAYCLRGWQNVRCAPPRAAYWAHQGCAARAAQHRSLTRITWVRRWCACATRSSAFWSVVASGAASAWWCPTG